jgi:hypothetical protein
MVAELLGRLRTRRSTIVALGCVAVLCWIDWKTFDVMWVKGRLYDPVTAHLSYLRHLAP